MNCSEAKPLLEAILQDNGEPADTAKVLQHLNKCSSCQSTWKDNPALDAHLHSYKEYATEPNKRPDPSKRAPRQAGKAGASPAGENKEEDSASSTVLDSDDDLEEPLVDDIIHLVDEEDDVTSPEQLVQESIRGLSDGDPIRMYLREIG